MRPWAAPLLVLSTALLGAEGATTPATEASPTASARAGDELSAEDRAILAHLELLLDLELLESWDPDQDLPIPVDEEGEP